MSRKRQIPRQQRQKLRCAIYTRKSSEEGLEQNFNSLHAQRDALFQAEKVAAMGQLLAGVAHELNNPLSTIVGYTQLLLRQVRDGAITERLDKIAKSAERCTRIVQNFLALARQHPPARQSVALTPLVEDALDLLAYPFKLDGIDPEHIARGASIRVDQRWPDEHLTRLGHVRDRRHAKPPSFPRVPAPHWSDTACVVSDRSQSRAVAFVAPVRGLLRAGG